MTFSMLPGSVLGCETNAHRHGWNGSICQAPSTWSCSRNPNPQFRSDYCETGDARCFHLHIFEAGDPHLVIESNGAGWILRDDPTALDDQVLLLWGQPYSEPRGIREGDSSGAIVYGAYRIRSVEPRERGSHVHWIVRPHPDGWARFANLKIPSPRYEALRGPYVKQVARSSFERVIQLARQTDDSDPSRSLSAEDRKRFESFCSQLPKWLEEATKRAQRHAPSMQIAPTPTANVLRSSFSSTPFKNIGNQVQTVSPPVVTPRESKPVQTSTPSPTPVGIVEAAKAEGIRALYGAETLTALQVASLTKPLLILRGNPGVGKSTLAGNLIDDPTRERTRIVAVTSTWRGREDLLGYVNPIHGEFEPTAFTMFLLESEKAWKAGRRETRIVVFEEFNLSQPEYWLSDVLVRSQLGDKDRLIDLGGAGVRGWKDRVSSVFLSPAIRFVATINADHTGRPISPRVLDRSAVVDITLEPGRALTTLDVDLDTDQLSALEELDFLLRGKGATFSLRTAKSLKQCLVHRATLELDPWGALDLVLLQELLTKVRLLAVDPTDQQLVAKLGEWSEGVGQKLVRCCREIETWRDLLQANRDVQKV